MSKTLSAQTLEDEYTDLVDFAQKNNRLSYADFDNLTLTDVNLFMMPKDAHFLNMETTLNKIIHALPALKRIFSNPITRLTDVYNVLPIESVRVINNLSMSHASRHSENWGDITNGELKPKKLMTLDREEDYALYENILFVKLIKMILSFVQKNLRLLKDMLYATRNLSFNLLERTNHLNYFLALGKLHLSYARTQDAYHPVYERCLEKLLFIDNALRSKLHAPIFRNCRKINAKLTLKKTNIFRLHKDYRQVYLLLKWFTAGKEDISETLFDNLTARDSYAAYCNMLAVFAAGHFNFNFSVKKRLNFLRLNASAAFHNWTLDLEEYRCDAIRGLLFTFHKDKPYRICVLFCHNGEHPKTKIEHFKNKCPADEYLFANPWEYGTDNCLYLSLFDIDSFRRIQRLLLCGMVYSDETRDICPFCGKALTNHNGVHRCSSCRTTIEEKRCLETGERYFETGIYAYSPLLSTQDNRKDKFLSDKHMEARLFFRNITKIDFFGKSVCPACGKQHVRR